jgi:hypothetical protein
MLCLIAISGFVPKRAWKFTIAVCKLEVAGNAGVYAWE